MSMGELGTLDVAVHLQSGGLDRGLASTRSKLGSFSTAVGTFAGNIASRFASMAGAMSMDVLGGTAIDMEKRMGGLAKATDLAAPAMAKMKGEIFALSTSLKGVGLHDLIQIATTGARMGIAQEGILKFTEAIAKASTGIDDMSSQDLAETLGSVNVVFKLGEDGAAQLASAFDKLDDSGIASFSTIANVTSRISATADAAGITAQETSALAATLLNTGSHAELASTSISRLIVALTDAEAQSSFAKAMGISVEEFAAKVKSSPIKAIQEFLAALARLSGAEQTEILKGINIEGVQGIGEIKKLATQASELGVNIGRVEHEFATLDQSTKSYAQTSSQTGAGLTQMQNRFIIMSDTIGTMMMPVINMLAEKFGGLATRIEGAFAGNKDRIGDFVAGFLSFADTIGTGLAAIGATLMEFPKHLNDAFGAGSWAGFLDFISSIGLIFRNLPAFFEIAALEITKHIVGLGAMFEHWGGTVSAVFGFMGETAMATFDFIVKFASNAFERVTANIRNIFNGLGQIMENVMTANVGDIFKGELDLLKGFKPEHGVESLLPEFKLPEFKLPEHDTGAEKSIQDQIDEKIEAIGAAEGRRGEKPVKPVEPGKLAPDFHNRFPMLMPGRSLGLGDPFAAAAEAAGKIPGTKQARAAAARAAKKARLAASRSEKGKATADRLARARGRKPGDKKDDKLKALEEANAKADKQVQVSEGILKALNGGIAARLS